MGVDWHHTVTLSYGSVEMLPLLLVVLLVQGKEYSCYSLAHEGRVVAHADTAAELSNLNYQHCAHPGIKHWVEKFVQGSGVSGQVSCTLSTRNSQFASKQGCRNAC